jgi:hypothetical protein
MSQDAGLIRRGLLLLVVMMGLVAVVLTIMFQRPRQALPLNDARPDLCATLVVATAPYPGAVSWPALYQVGQQLPSATGWEVRYNAAWALARLGSAHVPWPQFHEMLDEQRQMRNFRAQLDDGRNVPDEAKARETVLSALRALAEWHGKQKAAPPPSAERDAVYAQIDRLAAVSPIVQVKVEAEKTRSTFIR